MCVSDAPSAEEQSDEKGAAPAPRPDCGLSRAQRIAHTRIFREAYDHGRRYVGDLMVMWLRKGPDAALRLGVVASKRAFR